MDTKPFYLSRAMWGGIIAGLATLAQITGIANVSEADQAQLVDIIITVAQLGGIALGIYGRAVASQRLSIT